MKMVNGQRCIIKRTIICYSAILNHEIDDDLWSITYLTSNGASSGTAYTDHITPVTTLEQRKHWQELFDWHSKE